MISATVRSRGARRGQSFLHSMSTALHTISNSCSFGLKDSFDVSFAVEDTNDVQGVCLQSVINPNRFKSSNRP